MRRTPQAGNASRDTCKGVGARRTGETHGRCRGILFVIRMQDENAIHRTFNDRIYHIRLSRHAERHAQEVSGIGQAVVGIQERLPDRIFIRHRCNGRHLGDQPMAGNHPVGRIADVCGVVIECGKSPHDAAHDRHGMRIAAEATIKGRQLFV